MIRISKRTEYALIALLEMAHHDQADLITARWLSGKYNIPPEILNKVLQRLAKHKFIISQQGIKGGYRLNKSLAGISLYALIGVIDGPLKLVGCTIAEKINCGQHAACMIKQPMEIIQQELTGFFKKITLENLSSRYKYHSLAKTVEEFDG